MRKYKLYDIIFKIKTIFIVRSMHEIILTQYVVNTSKLSLHNLITHLNM